MKRTLLIWLFILPVHLMAQEVVSGYVADRVTNEPIPGATIYVQETRSTITTNEKGFFSIPNLKNETFTLFISHVGYQELQIKGKTGDKNPLTIYLNISINSSEQIVLSASKKREQISRAPASIRIIGTKEIERFASSNVSELLTNVQGIEVVRSGINMITFNARGFNGVLNNKFFFMIDGRNSMSSIGPGVALFSGSSVSTEDIENIEVIVGPHAALYGPNVHNGLFYITTKDPRDYPGTTIAVTAGNHRQLSSRLRYAQKINSKWAYKLNGEFSSGRDFIFYDTVYAGGTVYGPPVGIPEKNVDFDFRNLKGEGHVYYNIKPKFDVVFSAGASSNDFLGVNAVGRNQMRDLSHYFIQGRVMHPRFLATIYKVWTDIGNSFSISSFTCEFYNRTHSQLPPSDPVRGLLTAEQAEKVAKVFFRDKGQRINLDFQYNYTFNDQGLFVIAGASYQRELPRSFGTNLLDLHSRIKITQYGFVLHAEKNLPWNMRAIAAARIDHHSNFGNFVSPRLALIKNLKDGSFRLTWSKAFATPSVLHQYSHSNYQSFGNGPGIFYIPNGTRISDEPSFIRPLKPEEISTFEIGYKNKLTKKLYVDWNAYHGMSINFLSPLLNVSGRAIQVGKLPVTHNPASAGIIVNDTLRNAMFSTFFNFGKVNGYGTDLSLEYTFSEKFNSQIRYSYFNSNRRKNDLVNDANKDGLVSDEERSLNAPKHRLVLIAGLQKLTRKNFFATLSGRWTESYDFYSGIQVSAKKGANTRTPGRNFNRGPLGGYIIIDLNTGLQLNKNTSITAGITNLVNAKQYEYIGAPAIGRLISIEFKIHLPERE